MPTYLIPDLTAFKVSCDLPVRREGDLLARHEGIFWSGTYEGFFCSGMRGLPDPDWGTGRLSHDSWAQPPSPCTSEAECS